jgi:hypothetical protein
LDDDRSAALLIRVWVEDGIDELRARLTTMDAAGGAGPGGQTTFAVASSTGEVLDAVRRWLNEFTRSVANPIDTD